MPPLHCPAAKAANRSSVRRRSSTPLNHGSDFSTYSHHCPCCFVVPQSVVLSIRGPDRFAPSAARPSPQPTEAIMTRRTDLNSAASSRCRPSHCRRQGRLPSGAAGGAATAAARHDIAARVVLPRRCRSAICWLLFDAVVCGRRSDHRELRKARCRSAGRRCSAVVARPRCNICSFLKYTANY